MTTLAPPAATRTVPPQEYARRRSDPEEEFRHDGSVFITTSMKKGSYNIHPDWVSEDKRGAPQVAKPCACLDNTGIQRGHYVIHPDWVSEGSKFPRFEGRSHKPWPFEFKGARSWPSKPVSSRPPTVRSSWGGENSRPPTGYHVTEPKSGWLPVTARDPVVATRGDGMPGYSYNKVYRTSYGEHFNKTGPETPRGLGTASGGAVMPWRSSYNSWNNYSSELARSRREVPPRPSYMLPSNSSWVP